MQQLIPRPEHITPDEWRTFTNRQKHRAIKPLFTYWLPAAPLLRMFGPDADYTTVCQALDVSRSCYTRWRRPGARISFVDADKYACKLGVHPMYIWGLTWIEEQDPLINIREQNKAKVTSPS